MKIIRRIFKGILIKKNNKYLVWNGPSSSILPYFTEKIELANLFNIEQLQNNANNYLFDELNGSELLYCKKIINFEIKLHKGKKI